MLRNDLNKVFGLTLTIPYGTTDYKDSFKVVSFSVKRNDLKKSFKNVEQEVKRGNPVQLCYFPNENLLR